MPGSELKAVRDSHLEGSRNLWNCYRDAAWRAGGRSRARHRDHEAQRHHEDLIALGFSGSRAALAFEEMKPEAAWPVLNEHRLLVSTKGSALDVGIRQMELMVVDARLAALAKVLNQDDSKWRAEAA